MKKLTGDHKGRTLLYSCIVGCDPCGRPSLDEKIKEHYHAHTHQVKNGWVYPVMPTKSISLDV